MSVTTNDIEQLVELYDEIIELKDKQLKAAHRRTEYACQVVDGLLHYLRITRGGTTLTNKAKKVIDKIREDSLN